MTFSAAAFILSQPIPPRPHKTALQTSPHRPRLPPVSAALQTLTRPLLRQTGALLTGLTASTLGSLVGAGGGIVLTPLLTASGLGQHKAHGTSLCIVAATAVISAARYGQSAAVDPLAALYLACTALLSAPVGVHLSARLDASILRRCFGVFLVIVAALIPIVPRLSGGILLGGAARAAVLLILGGVAGLLSGLLGIGGGTVNVPALVLLAGFPQTIAQGTAMLAMVLPSVRGAFAHARLGQVERGLLPGLLVGAVAGGLLGAGAALRLPERTLRIVCSGLFAAMGLRYVMPRRAKG